MPAIHTTKILPKLERVVDFRVGENASQKIKIELKQDSYPATDGTQIFLPQTEKHFKIEKDNEMFVANSCAHESDHIREINEYYGEEAEKLREQGASLVAEYLEKNYSGLTENHALACWIDNIVKDRRIDDKRKRELPGVERYFKEIFDPVASYFRPSIKGMSELDVFREQYLQKSLIGKTIEPVLEKHSQVLEEIVQLTNSADDINKDPKIVKQIYQKFKDNFNITQPISRLPNMFGRGGEHSRQSGKGSPSQQGTPQQSNENPKQNPKDYQGKEQDKESDKEQKENKHREKDDKEQKGNEDKRKEDKKTQDKEESKDNKEGNEGPKYEPKQPYDSQKGYGKEIKPRQGRNPKDKIPKALEQEKEPKESKDDKSKKESKTSNKDDENQDYINPREQEEIDFYWQNKEKYGFQLYILKPEINKNLESYIRNLESSHAGEIESMKRIFRKLKLKGYGDKRDFQGLELDYEEFLQGELEAKITGIKGKSRCFKEKIQNKQKPVFGIHADISGSTEGAIIEAIKSAFYIIGNSLSESNYNYSMYASNDDVFVLKSPTQKWRDEINYSIADLNSRGGGIYLEATSSAIADDLKRIEGAPKCLITISDFEVCGVIKREEKIVKKLYDSKIYSFLIAIGTEHEQHAKDLTKEIGEEHYSVIPIDKLYQIPDEIFRLFKTFGIAR